MKTFAMIFGVFLILLGFAIATVYVVDTRIKAKQISLQFQRQFETDPRCDGPARYDAMREAYEAGRPFPC